MCNPGPKNRDLSCASSFFSFVPSIIAAVIAWCYVKAVAKKAAEIIRVVYADPFGDAGDGLLVQSQQVAGRFEALADEVIVHLEQAGVLTPR